MMRCFVYTALNYNSPDSYDHFLKPISHFVPIQCIFAQRGSRGRHPLQIHRKRSDVVIAPYVFDILFIPIRW